MTFKAFLNLVIPRELGFVFLGTAIHRKKNAILQVYCYCEFDSPALVSLRKTMLINNKDQPFSVLESGKK
jgi:hypothetical protein